MTEASHDDHITCLRKCLDLARKSPPKQTNFRVGAIICSYTAPITDNIPRTLSTGYTLELEGNTHAEQCALDKLIAGTGQDLSNVLTAGTGAILYTSLEPCSRRLSGNLPCVQRIIATRKGNTAGGIRKVVFGAKEPGTFVKDSKSCQLLTEANIDWEYIPDLEAEILEVAMQGHVKQTGKAAGSTLQDEQGHPTEQKGTNVDDISIEERKRQQFLPRNPKKRMMEVNVPANASNDT